MSPPYRLLDLFSGIGGFSLGLERSGGFQTVAFCEIEDFPRKVLKKHWPEVTIYDDVRTLTYVRGQADIICGGFPCQDLSLAGKRAGVSGARSGLYREMLRAICVVRPRHAIMENVAALLGFGMGRVLGDVAEDGYDAEWDCISASDVGAPHGRDRVWLTLTDPDQFKRAQRRSPGHGWWHWSPQEVGEARDADGVWKLEPPRLLGEIRRRLDHAARTGTRWACDWQTKFEALRRMDDGVPGRLDKAAISASVKGLGNAVVPEIPELIGRAILAAETSMGAAA